MGRWRLQNGCQLHYHTADSVLSSGCSFISQQIWIKIFIMLGIIGICIKIENLSAGKRTMYIQISGWHTIDFGCLSTLIVSGWHRWRSGLMWHQFRCQLSESLWWMCTRASVPPVCMGILCGAIVAREADIRSIFPKQAGCLSIAAYTCLFPAISTPCCFSSQNSTRDSFIRYCVSTLAVRNIAPLALLAIFKAWCMSDCYSCTWPPCVVIVADMLKTYNKLVAASRYQIQLLPLPYTLPYHPLRLLQPVSSTLGDAFHSILPQESQNWNYHDVRFGGLCRLMAWSTMDLSHQRLL